MQNRYAATIDDQYWRHRALLYWIYLVVESHTGNGLPVGAKRLKGKTLQKLPPEVRQGIQHDPDTQQVILNALDRGTGWFCKLENKGWHAGQRGGTREVVLVHDTLEWIDQFRSKQTVGGNKLLWASVDSKVEQHG